MIPTMPKAFLTTKKRKDPMAIDALNAPMGARKIPGGRLGVFCARSWPT